MVMMKRTPIEMRGVSLCLDLPLPVSAAMCIQRVRRKNHKARSLTRDPCPTLAESKLPAMRVDHTCESERERSAETDPRLAIQLARSSVRPSIDTCSCRAASSNALINCNWHWSTLASTSRFWSASFIRRSTCGRRNARLGECQHAKLGLGYLRPRAHSSASWCSKHASMSLRSLPMRSLWAVLMLTDVT